ncbi:hypothetical protein TrRE_jg7180 [Triparma retinervis]|uniref:Uncharacterized protein n=1 Tax=Triparma retinervis TaxID=2557542 RepID=A0A9W6ZRJ1_9STRA|nr:hypothetical protein TrRE_jg7180 [Triparma retinervis]
MKKEKRRITQGQLKHQFTKITAFERTNNDKEAEVHHCPNCGDEFGRMRDRTRLGRKFCYHLMEKANCRNSQAVMGGESWLRDFRGKVIDFIDKGGEEQQRNKGLMKKKESLEEKEKRAGQRGICPIPGCDLGLAWRKSLNYGQGGWTNTCNSERCAKSTSTSTKEQKTACGGKRPRSGSPGSAAAASSASVPSQAGSAAAASSVSVRASRPGSAYGGGGTSRGYGGGAPGGYGSNQQRDGGSAYGGGGGSGGYGNSGFQRDFSTSTNSGNNAHPSSLSHSSYSDRGGGGSFGRGDHQSTPASQGGYGNSSQRDSRQYGDSPYGNIRGRSDTASQSRGGDRNRERSTSFERFNRGRDNTDAQEDEALQAALRASMEDDTNNGGAKPTVNQGSVRSADAQEDEALQAALRASMEDDTNNGGAKPTVNQGSVSLGELQEEVALQAALRASMEDRTNNGGGSGSN